MAVTIVARELEIRLIETMKRAGTDILNRNGDGWLIVDDLVDTGETASP